MEKEKKIPERCPQCGKKVIYFSGVNREGREYHFYACEDRRGCGWIYREQSKAEQRHEEEMKAMRLIYAKLLEIEREIKKIAPRSHEFQKVDTKIDLTKKGLS
ncbi:MAG: hypothetical protein NC926_09840 [Candidatus Omnitrophica bacterium]|nr:hypothetical protein [Candidatus Omnitrophota bacterium]